MSACQASKTGQSPSGFRHAQGARVLDTPDVREYKTFMWVKAQCEVANVAAQMCGSR